MQSIEVDRALRAPDELNRSLADKIQEFEEEADRILSDERWNAYSDPVLRDYDRAIAIEAAAQKILGGAWRAHQDARLGAIATLDAAASTADAQLTRATDPRRHGDLSALRADLKARLAHATNAEAIRDVVREFAGRSPAHAAAAWLESPAVLELAAALSPSHPGDAARVQAEVRTALEEAMGRAYPGADQLLAARERYRRGIQGLSTDVPAIRAIYWARRKHLARVVGTAGSASVRHSIRRGPRVVADYGHEWSWSVDAWLRGRPQDTIRIEQGGSALREAATLQR